MKKIVKALLPDGVLARMKMAKVYRRNARFRGLSTEEVFSEVYRSGMWGKSKDPDQPFYSGTGSHDDAITETYIAGVRDVLSALPERPDVVDLGCGDFHVGSRVRPFCNGYVACDIVPGLIEHNRVRYRDLDVDFRVLNLVTDPLPDGDIVFIRQVLQHLSNEQIVQLLPKLVAKYAMLVLTEHLPAAAKFTPNRDKPSGPDIRIGFNSGIVLTAPPFDLQAIDQRVLCEVREHGGLIRTTLYTLR